MTALSPEAVRSRIVAICRKLNAKNYLASADGNVSCRLNEKEIVITPAGVNKADIEPGDLATITPDNQILSGKPSSERLMHLAVYRRCPAARAVVHAHPPTAIAWSIARPDLTELPSECMSELILAVGSIPIAPYARPGTEAMGTALEPFLPGCRVLILGNHGALSWGEDLDEAYNGMERLEHSAMILKAAFELGGLNPLPAAEVAVLRGMRARLGERTL
jgi:L-fuculose-phosphate aldolase